MKQKPTKYFRVVKQNDNVEQVSYQMLTRTLHFREDRLERLWNILLCLNGDLGKCVYSFEVDKKHPMGNEIHTITDNGVVYIQNATTKKLVTMIVSTREHLKRYFEGRAYPLEFGKILKKAAEHDRNGVSRL